MDSSSAMTSSLLPSMYFPSNRYLLLASSCGQRRTNSSISAFEIRSSSIYLKHERLMYYIAGKYSEVSVQREDIVQTAVLSLLKNEATLQRLPPYAQINYIAAAVRNTAINTIKRDQKEAARCTPLDDLTEDFPQTHIPGAEVRYLEKERQEELLTAFQEMREEEKQLLYGKYLMDLSDAELAQMLGCKPSSVRMKLTRARRAFVEKLREGGKKHE